MGARLDHFAPAENGGWSAWTPRGISSRVDSSRPVSGTVRKRAEPKLRPGGERSRAPNELLNPERSGSSSLGLDLQRSCRDFVPFQGSRHCPTKLAPSSRGLGFEYDPLLAARPAKPTSPRRPNHPQSVLFSAAAGGAPLRGGYSRLRVPFTAVPPRQFPA